MDGKNSAAFCRDRRPCPATDYLYTVHTASEQHAARGSWRAYYEKWECVTRERLNPHLLELAEPLNRFIPPAQVMDRQSYGAFINGASGREA
jgi:hypothetical protein